MLFTVQKLLSHFLAQKLQFKQKNAQHNGAKGGEVRGIEKGKERALELGPMKGSGKVRTKGSQ